MPRTKKSPPVPIVGRSFPCPKPGDIWQTRTIRGRLYSKVSYVVVRNETDWDASLLTPSGPMTVEPLVNASALHEHRWLPEGWVWNPTYRVWLSADEHAYMEATGCDMTELRRLQDTEQRRRSMAEARAGAA